MIIKTDRWDKRVFNEAFDYTENMREVEIMGSKRQHNFADFMLDIFGGLFKYNPEIRDRNTAPKTEQWADNIYNEISNLQEWKNLRERTRMNEDASATATTEFCLRFMDAVPDKNKKGEPNIDMSAVRRAARAACDKAAAEADKTNEMLAAFAYGDGTGRPQHASPNMKKDVARKLMENEHVKRIAELAGRMRRIAGEKQRQKTKHGVDELSDIMTGDDLARLIPAEIIKLSHPLLKMDFQKKLLERQLLQYKLSGREKLGKGSLVVCIDESASMQGDCDIWAKAVALALLQVAQQQNRHYVMIHFDSQVTRVDEFTKATDPTSIMDAVAHFGNGGTNFIYPLERARDIIRADKEYQNADIVFITDGSCSIDAEWLAEYKKDKEKLQFNIISVVISDYNKICDQFSDTVVNINSINEDEEALNNMFSI